VADGEAGFGGVLNAFELMKNMIDAGRRACISRTSWLGEEVRPHGRQGAGADPEAIQKLHAARLAADVLGVPTIVLARTDAEAANLLTSDFDPTTSPSSPASAPAKASTRQERPGAGHQPRRGLCALRRPGVVRDRHPDLGFAREFAEAVHAASPGKLLAYNCSPSFNWKKNLDDATIAKFQDELSALGYKYQFITLAGIHINWFNTFKFAHDYARGEGMKHYVEQVQEPSSPRARRATPSSRTSRKSAPATSTT
jgi:isocitrate lyase